MSFCISGLSPTLFRPLFGKPDAELARAGVERCVADAWPGYPDRIELRDAERGETLLLLNFEHQAAPTPYRSRHAIFVLEGACTPCRVFDRVPPALRRRTLSLRAFDVRHRMVDAALVDGERAEEAIRRLFEAPRTDYIQAHYALRGCYAAHIERSKRNPS